VLDSHSCTVGALGVAAWASCAGDVLHTLATQTSILKKPPLMRITLSGQPGYGVTPKDIMLNVIRRLGIAGSAGYAVEFAGPVIRDMPMEGRFTVCNMAVELGARFAMIAPDQTTLDYLKAVLTRPVLRIGTRRRAIGWSWPPMPTPVSTAKLNWTWAASSRRSPGATARRT